MTMQSLKAVCLALAVAVATLGLATSDARAQDREAGPYIHADVGAHWIQDINTKAGGERLTVKVDPGIRFSVGAGYRIYPAELLAIGFELDTGFIWNSLDRFRLGGLSGSLSGDIYQVPFIGNVVFNLEPSPRWVLYVGGGGGGIYRHVSVDRVAGVPLRVRGNAVDGTAQALGGLRYELTDRASLGIGFKFLNVFASGADDIRQHSIGLSYNMQY